MGDSQKKIEALEAENRSLRSRRSSEGLRDSFGSFIDTSNPVINRRWSTVGITCVSSSTTNASASASTSASTSRQSMSHPSLPEKDSLKRSAPGPSTVSTVSTVSTSAVPLSTTQKANRRISLIERSKMAASHSAASFSAPSTSAGSSRTVTGVARLTNRRVSTGTRRFSLVRSRAATGLTDSKEKKRGEEGEEKEKAEGGKSVKRNNSAAEQTEKIIISPTKRRRYTVSVNRNSQPSYTFTPSTDRRKTLDSLLMKATKLNESDSTLNNTSELCSVFLLSIMLSYLFDLDILSKT